MKRKGFSSLELIIGLALTAIMATMGIVNFSSQDALLLDAAAQKVVSDLNYARMLAIDMGEQSEYTYSGGEAGEEAGNFVVMDFSDEASTLPSSYRAVPALQLPAETGDPVGTRISVLYEPVVRNITEKVELFFPSEDDFKQVKIQSVDFGDDGSGGAYNAVRFEGPTGRPMNGTWVMGNDENAYFSTDTGLGSSGGIIVVEYNGRTKIVRISRIGRITIEN
ncbi:MAG: hypothetical protein KJ593_04050 [Candidatus Omnitrophica bacterium]|nr:hypothetical protein [Candidatus Omnitrophota bacterium]